MDQLPQVIANGLLLGAVLALVAVGLTLIFGVVDVVNFAHGEFVMAGMYAAFFAWSLFGLDPILAIPITAAIVAAIGLASYASFVRPALRGTLLSQIFVTFGLLIFLRGIAQVAFGPNFRSITGSVLGGASIQFLGVALPRPQLAAAVGSLIGMGLISWFVWRTRTGHALMATAQDRDAAALMGINPNRMFGLAWIIGGAATGLAAALLAVYQPIHPTAGLVFGLTAFIIVAMGGFGSIAGAFVAAMLVGLLENVAGFYLDPAYKHLWVFLLFIVVLVWRPQGLLGRR
jgi:branched-chain amino acid transport system permease protein